ncbi:MAG: acetyltransferase [Pseudomonadota bacterium]
MPDGHAGSFDFANRPAYRSRLAVQVKDMAKVVLFGAGKIAEEIYSYFTHDSDHEVVAFSVDQAYLSFDSLFGLPVVAFEDVVEAYPPADFGMFVATGYQQLNRLREAKFQAAKRKGYRLVSYVCSKAANIGSVEIGENSLVLEHATIQPSSRIGANVFVWSGNHIGHHAVIRDHVYVAGHVTVGGGADIGENCFLGINSTIGHNVQLGARCVVGAGARVLKSADDGAVFIEPSTERYRLDSEYLLKLGGLE